VRREPGHANHCLRPAIVPEEHLPLGEEHLGERHAGRTPNPRVLEKRIEPADDERSFVVAGRTQRAGRHDERLDERVEPMDAHARPERPRHPGAPAPRLSDPPCIVLTAEDGRQARVDLGDVLDDRLDRFGRHRRDAQLVGRRSERAAAHLAVAFD